MPATTSLCDELSQHQANIKDAYRIDGTLHFKTLTNSLCNPPVYLYKLEGETEIPIGVLKPEIENHSFANSRFAMLDEMSQNGFKFHPTIYKNKNGDYLTKFGSTYYSLIEYIIPDPGHPEKNMKFADMVTLTARFHAASQHLTYRPELVFSRYDLHMSRQHIIDELDTLGIKTDFFNSKSWQRFLPLYRYFSSPAAKALFALLPKQIINGDNSTGNIIFHAAEAYHIDLDTRRYDVRLYDFSSFIRHSTDVIEDEYFKLAESGKLFSIIEEHYNITPLTQIEKDNFHLILAFSYTEFISWALNRIKEQAQNEQYEPVNRLMNLIQHRVNCIIKQFDGKLLDEKKFMAASNQDLANNNATLFADHRSPDSAQRNPGMLPTL